MQNPSSPAGSLDPNVVAGRLMQRAHNRDGLPEIAVGLNFLLAASLIYAQVVLPKGSNGFRLAALAFALLLPSLLFGSLWALQWVRRRYLIERVGYVERRPMGRRQIGLGIAIAALMALAVFGVAPRLSQPDRWLLGGTGLFGGALMAWCGRLARFVIGGAVMAAAGVCVAFAGVSLLMGFTLLFGFQGLVTLVSGGVVFLRFIRQPVETSE
ncbi:MAG: hypothetical protein ABSB88_19680 [Bryobacteraceae bacterium]|jgi:hypothetical protein